MPSFETHHIYLYIVDWLNSLYPGVVKFKHEFSTKSVEFLDLIISIENSKIETNLYIKPSNKQLYLDFFSNHPDHCKKGVIYGQALRVIERCSNKKDADIHLENLKSKLIKRNYPEELINSNFRKARKKSRENLIYQTRKERSGSDRKVRLIFTYNRGNPPLIWMV